MFAPKRILVPTDFSKHSEAALDKAADMAARYGAKLYLLHVITAQTRRCVEDYCLDAKLFKDLEKQSLKGAKERLKKVADGVARKKQVEILLEVQTGVPQEVILAEQKAKKADLIAIGSHGQSGILKHLMGSVAEKVVRGAKSPVLVFKS